MKRWNTKLMVCLVGASLALATQSVHALLLGEQVLNGEFGTNATPSLTSWTYSPTTGEVNARASTDTINTSTGALGFDGFFTSAFAVLGDSAAQIGVGPTNGTMSLSQTFVLPGTVGSQAVTSYDLAISFWAAFDGLDTASAGVDLFSASLLTSLLSWNSDANLGSSQMYSATLFGLAPGSYTIAFVLTEVNVPGNPAVVGDTNTAAGIDKVSVIATANVQAATPGAVPEPGALALLAAGLLAIAATRRRPRRAA